MAQNKTLVIVTGSMVRGGAEGVIHTVSDALARRGWKVFILAILYGENAYPLEKGVEYVDLTHGKRNGYSDAPRMILDLRREIRRIHPDAVISFMAKINIITRFALAGIPCRFIVSERNDPSVGRNALYRKLVEFAYAKADTVVFQTSRAKRYFKGRIREKGVIIPNPVAPLPAAFPERDQRIVAVGRLSKQKNHKLLIDAFEKIHSLYPKFSLEIYGEGNLRAELERYIERKQLADFVRLPGKVDDAPERLRGAYMFVHTSDYEGFSNALLEAMAVGLPCVTTDCAGSEDAIQNGENGLIVPVGDCDAVFKAMKSVIENPEAALEMGKRAKESVARYQVEPITNQWEALL